MEPAERLFTLTPLRKDKNVASPRVLGFVVDSDDHSLVLKYAQPVQSGESFVIRTAGVATPTEYIVGVSTPTSVTRDTDVPKHLCQRGGKDAARLGALYYGEPRPGGVRASQRAQALRSSWSRDAARGCVCRELAACPARSTHDTLALARSFDAAFSARRTS